jgi:hypothetical protein
MVRELHSMSSSPFSQSPNGVVSGKVSFVLAWQQEEDEGTGGDSWEPEVSYG